MSTATFAATARSAPPVQLWISQLRAIVRIELKRTIWMRRSIWIYFIAFGPAVIFGLHALNNPMGRYCSIEQDTTVLADVFQIFFLRAGIFFGCMGLFTWLFRGDVMEKSLHYYFLSPVRRQVLVIGKFIAGVLGSWIIFCSSLLLSFTFVYGHFGPAGRNFVFHGPGLGHLLAYLSVTMLGCLGYGSVFLALSLVFRNPIIPAGVVLLWETFHAVLPSLLQKLSIMFYLKQLCPVNVLPQGLMALFSVVAEPVSPWIAVPGLLILCGAIVVFACFRIHKTEISYLAE